jgi:UDP-N-acetylglucosamine 1-carboxyvinyltransferase
MDVFKICGGKALKGTVEVSGSKNAALPMFAAALLTSEEVIIRNVPDISDLRYMATIIESMGAEVVRDDPHTFRIRAKVVCTKAPYDMVRKMRASVCLMGPLVGRCGVAQVAMPEARDWPTAD